MKYNNQINNNTSIKKIYQKIFYGLIKRHHYYLSSPFRVLPEADQKGKLVHVFQKIPTNDYHDLAEFVIDSKKSDLKYLVIDKDNKLFDNLRKNPAGYPYLNKIFDSNDFDFENHFMIY